VSKADFLVIGQAPGPKPGKRRRALDSDVPSGLRLARLAGVGTLHDHARVVNLLDKFPGKAGKGDAFPIAQARFRAGRMRFGGARTVIFVGKNVARAFGVNRTAAFFEHFIFWKGGRSFHAWLSPHPSGANHWWNDPANVEKARNFWSTVLEFSPCR
jgi:uracil-DNA glycosylase